MVAGCRGHARQDHQCYGFIRFRHAHDERGHGTRQAIEHTTLFGATPKTLKTL